MTEESSLVNVEVSTSMRCYLSEASIGLQNKRKDEAIELIQERMREIEQLKFLLAKAERNLEELLDSDVNEVLVFSDKQEKRTARSYPFSLKGW
jgi:DNA-binding protein H-NS